MQSCFYLRSDFADLGYLNIIDQGTSILVAHHVRSDFTAETALAAVAQTFREQGLPTSITLDRDTRWVGAPQGSDFPAALVRFCQSLGVAVFLCDPHHPQQNGFGERYHRTLNQECLMPSRPKTLEEVRQVTDAFATHYNWQRPHQGIACGNQPPRVAFPDLPSLPRVPDLVNPDAWLSDVKEQHLVRKVNRQGFVKVDLYPYYLSNKLAGQKVTLAIHADEQSLEGSVAKIFKPIKLMRIRKSYVSKTCRRCAPFLKRHALYCNSTLVFDEFKNFCNTTAKGGKGG